MAKKKKKKKGTRKKKKTTSSHRRAKKTSHHGGKKGRKKGKKGGRKGRRKSRKAKHEASAPAAPKRKRKGKGRGRKKKGGKHHRGKRHHHSGSGRLENALKLGFKVGLGVIGGLLLEKAVGVPPEVSGPAIGVAIAGMVDKGRLAMPSSAFLTGAIAFQVLHTVQKTEVYNKLEAKLVTALEPTTKLAG